ncbi:MAG: DUF1343 domain-containing protein [Porphyromonas sp.]|nr:DUF1343 domain-containing protein [Porphyromonas sp.]
MKRTLFTLLLLLLPTFLYSQISVGADRIESILSEVDGKCIGMVVNHTSLLSTPNHTHIVDTLNTLGVNIVRLYTPEHGLRGTMDAGASVASGRDKKTGLPVISLYGNNRKPTPTQVAGIDLMLFDLQDVGVRFYTYISTLTYVMEACAEAGIPIIILDRPNPHDTVDGAVRKEDRYRSFVSLLPIPAVHGLTLGEAAMMINGEKWLKGGIKADVKVITVKGWRHGQPYNLITPPSPNLKSNRAIALYPTLCYFEGTSWSEGRGTPNPFEQIGYPNPHLGNHTFTPKSMIGATRPKHQGKKCYGPDLETYQWSKGIHLQVLIDAYRISQTQGIKFFKHRQMFDLLAGSDQLRRQIISGQSAAEIRQSWQKDLQDYKRIRSKYLLYPDYE